MLDNISKYQKIKISIFAIVAIFFFIRLSFFVEPMFGGDMFEYFLMTESFKNHYSFDLRIEDLDSYNAMAVKFYPGNGWLIQINDGIKNLFTNKEFLSTSSAYYTALDGEKISYHFWFYPLINVPVSAVQSLFGFNGFKSIQITNFFIVFGVLLYTLFYSRINEKKRMFASIFFLFSSTLWYIPFPGPEIFSMSLLFLGILLYYEKKFLLSFFFIVLASLQNPPIILFAAPVCLSFLQEKGPSYKNFLKLFLIGSLSALPTAFYLYYFKIPNLIMHQGYLKPNLNNFSRYLNFFFDLNQGLFLAFPLLFFLSIFLLIKNLTKKWQNDMLFILIVPLVVYSFITIVTFLGGANIARYATWCSIPFLLYAVMNFDFDNGWNMKIIQPLILLQILFVYNAFNLLNAGEFNFKGYMTGNHNNLAITVMDNFPWLYNPDPDVFIIKTLHSSFVSEDNSPVIYSTNEGKPRKLIFHFLKLNMLPDSIRLSTQIKNINFNDGWGYYNFEN
ncbi:hypothetical protein [Sporocytophaga myxococcoides]|uniref:hypothetical protein n=1 Tax=Sporocytophaga myxococcoides TaxID=153721 RepID=UPI00048E185C|nr:hypothetical protein [Sporocytophaga myxococcoides]